MARWFTFGVSTTGILAICLPFIAHSDPQWPLTAETLNSACTWSAATDSHIAYNPQIHFERAIDNNDRFDFADLEKARAGLEAAIFDQDLPAKLRTHGYPNIRSADSVLAEVQKHADHQAIYAADKMAAFIRRLESVKADTERSNYPKALTDVGFSSACETVFAAAEPNRQAAVSECVAAVQAGYDMGKNWNFMQPMAMGFDFAKLMQDPAADQVLARSALKLVRKARAQNTAAGGDFFSDVYQEALAVKGGDERAALELTENILAVYSARGANYESAMIEANHENVFSVVSLQILSAAMTVLDFASFGQPKQYAYPETYTTGCAFGRPYHFWMPYIISKRLQRQGFSDLAVFAAVQNLQLGYSALHSNASSHGDVDLSYLMEVKKNFVVDKLGILAGLHANRPLPQGAATMMMVEMANALPPTQELTPQFLAYWDRIPVLTRAAIWASHSLAFVDQNQIKLWLNSVAPWVALDEARKYLN